MLKLSIRGFAARKVRLALTLLAVALGVALIAGTYVLTDTINKSFDTIFTTAAKGTDVSITARDAVDTGNGNDAVSTIPASFLTRITAVPGVATAAGSVSTSNVALFTSSGSRVGGGGAPTQVQSVTPKPFSAVSYVQGRAPATDGEVALLESTAKDKGIKLGDSVSIVGNGPRHNLKVVGLGKFGGVSNVGGFVLVLVTLPEAQRLADEPGQFNQIVVAADSGVSATQLRDRIQAVSPPTVNVRTGQQQAQQDVSDIHDALGFLTTALLAFGGISLFVGAFIIFNTFSITVAQRMREFALLRTLGASRRQVMTQVLFEGLLIGLAGSVIGLLVGIALAKGLRALFKALGADLPSQGTVIETRTIVVSLVVGTLVTLLSGLAPAIRATKVPPVAALREGAVLPAGRSARFITPGGIVLAVLGAIGIALGLFGGGSVALVGAGALFVFLGIALLSPKLVPPLASFIGAPMPGIIGRLARENATRQAGRTAVTASALMIGVTLVAFVSIFAQGLKATIDDAVDTAARPGTLIVENTASGNPLPAQVAAGLAKVPGVQTVAPVTFATSQVQGVSGKTPVSGVPANIGKVFDTKWKQGGPTTFATLGTTGAVVTKKFADANDVKVGSRLNVLTPLGKRLTLTVRGIADDSSELLADLSVSHALAVSDFGKTGDALVFAGVDPAQEQQVKQVLDKTLSALFPIAEAKTIQQFKDQQAGQINGLLILIYVLLLLAVIISLFGIVNTLVLSIYERTRELGMLRAIGTSRKQVKRMIRYESIITAVIGAVIGVVLGIVFALAVAQALTGDGYKLAIPVGQLVILLVLGGLAGVLAAILPARRAARLNVLEALAYE